MNKLEAYSDNFKANYEKFIFGCDSLEEVNRWDKEADGEMEAYYSNILVSVILKLIGADGVFTEKEVEYFNDVFGFSCQVDELEAVYADSRENIDGDFIGSIGSEVEKLEAVNEKLAEAFRDLLSMAAEIISESDGIQQKAEMELLVALKKLVEE